MISIPMLLIALSFFLGLFIIWTAINLARFYGRKQQLEINERAYSVFLGYPFGALCGAYAAYSARGFEEYFFFLMFLFLNCCLLYIDLLYGLLPYRLSFALGITGILYMGRFYNVMDALFAAFAIFCLMWLLYYLAKGGMGGGDPMYATALAAWCTPGNAIFLLWTAFMIGGLFSLLLYLTGKYHGKSEVPFGPFLAFSGYIAVVARLQWWYFYV